MTTGATLIVFGKHAVNPVDVSMVAEQPGADGLQHIVIGLSNGHFIALPAASFPFTSVVRALQGFNQ